MEIKGNITNKDGFATSVSLPDHVKVEIAGVSYNYFINNKEERKQVIKKLKIGDLVKAELKESNGFKFLDNIVVLETKELPERLPHQPNNYGGGIESPAVETMKIPPRNDIKHGLAFKLTYQKWIFMKRIDPLTDETAFLQDVDNTYDLMSK